MKIYGIKANVYLKYDDDLHTLVNLISEKMQLPKFFFKSDQDEPHEITAMSETLGFEIWIKKSRDLKNFPFEINMESQLSLEELFNDQMYDTSAWLARYISKILNIDSCFLDIETKKYYSFKDGEISQGDLL